MRTALPLVAIVAFAGLMLPRPAAAQLEVERPELDLEGFSLEVFAAHMPGGPAAWGVQVRSPDGITTGHRLEHVLSNGQFGGFAIRYDVLPRLRASVSLAAAASWRRGLSIDPQEAQYADVGFSGGSLFLATAGAEAAVIDRHDLRLWAGAGAGVLHQDPEDIRLTTSGWVVRTPDEFRSSATSPTAYVRGALEVPVPALAPGLSVSLAADHNWVRWDPDALLTGLETVFSEQEAGARPAVSSDVLGSTFFVVRLGVAYRLGGNGT